MIGNISCFSDFYGVYMFCMPGLEAGFGGGAVYYRCETIRLCCRCNTVVIQSVEVPVTFYD